jgi:dTMP kinase
MSRAVEEIPELPRPQPNGLRALLTHPSFSRLWKAMLVSSLGDWVGFVAVAALVARLGGTAARGGLAVAGVMLARLSPSVLFGPFAGVFTDRFDRRKLMVSADIARGVLYASMPFMPGLWAIFALSFVIECLSLLWTPAKDASIPNMVSRRQLANANSIGLVTTYGTLPLGGAIFAALAGVSGAIGHGVPYFKHAPEFLALWLDAVTFAFSARMVWGLDLRQNAASRLRARSVPKLNLRSAWEEAKEGYRFLGEHVLVRAMTLGIVLGFGAVGAVIALGPIFARFDVHAGATGFGYLITAFGIGMGAGLGLLNVLTRFVEKDRLFYGAMLGSAACLFGLAAMRSIALASVFAVPMGVGVGLTWVTGYTLLQENVEDEFRGRTFATLTISARMALFLALVAFPLLGAAAGLHHFVHVGEHVLDFSGTRIALWTAGCVVVFAGLWSRRNLRRMRLARPRPLTISPKLRHEPRPGVFVTFEGVEGSGKGTQIELAAAYAREIGCQVLVTREPGGTDFGDRLRATILDPATGRVDARAEALLFAAARAQLVTHVIRPALSEGKVVLCDRFVDSSLAYQGVARGLGEQDVAKLNDWATQGLTPDLVVLLNLDPEEGLSRAAQDPDRIEAEDLAFHAKVSDAYLRIAEENPERFAVIDAHGSPEEVHQRVRIALGAVLRRGTEGRAGAT